jgi:biopolymer transport protein ExbD
MPTNSLSGTMRNEGRSDTCKPQLTSLIDVMTILLVFLIKSFSVEGNLVTPATDLQLPTSTAREQPQPTKTIAITQSDVIGDGQVLASISSFADADSMLISPVLNWLGGTAESGDEAPPREIIIQSDRELEFHIVKKVMYTCSKAGYADFTVLVLREG